MSQRIGYVTLLVREYDEALAYFINCLHFEVLEDTLLNEGKRWLLVAPPNTVGTALLLARATTPEQVTCIGNQAGGRVFLFLHTTNFWQDYQAMSSRGVEFLEEPRQENYGLVAVFQDLYGNRWDLLELTRA